MFRRNPNVEAEIKSQDDYRQGIAAAAEEARRNANLFSMQAGGPWMPRAGQRQAVVLEQSGDTIRLVATGHGGHLIEWGSSNNPPHAPLRRGVRAAGLKLDES